MNNYNNIELDRYWTLKLLSHRSVIGIRIKCILIVGTNALSQYIHSKVLKSM